MPPEVAITTQPEQTLYGVWQDASDKTIAKDINVASARYWQMLGRAPGSLLPFFVLSEGYDPATKQFRLFIGGLAAHSGLTPYTTPAGMYGHMTIRPKLGFLWGPAIGEAKRYFYTKWLPTSHHEALNMEYEFHTEKSVGKKPEIDLYFAIRARKG